MARNADIPVSKSVELDMAELALIQSAIALKDASLARFVKSQVPGTALYEAYQVELANFRKLASKF